MATIPQTRPISQPVTNASFRPQHANGVYAYGSGALFPTNTYNSSNYWVDVVYGGPPLQAPVATNDASPSVVENNSTSIAASALLANVQRHPNGLPLSITGVGNPSHGTVTYDANTKTVTFTPTAGYAGSAGFAYTISDGQAPSASGDGQPHRDAARPNRE